MFCLECGEYVEDGEVFCPSCGAPMHDNPDAANDADAQGVAAPAASVSTPVTQAIPAAAAAPTSSYKTPIVGNGTPAPGVGSRPSINPRPAVTVNQGVPTMPAQDEGSSRKKIVILAIVLAALVLLGLIIGLTQCSKGDDAKSGNTLTVEPQQPEETDTTEADNKPTDSDEEKDAEAEQAEAEEAARQAAIDAGKEVFTGKLIVTTMAQRAFDRNPDLHDFDGNNTPYVVLQLDSPMEIQGMAGDGTGMITDTVDSIALPLGQFDSYDGKTISIAAAPEDIWFYSDVAGVLAPVHTDIAELIVPIDGSAPASAASSSTSSSAGQDSTYVPAPVTTTDPAPAPEPAPAPAPAPAPEPVVTGDDGDPSSYVLSDTNSRYYSIEELQTMDDLALYHARNEIYARHGRLFRNTDLQDYFNGKDWYAGTIAPDDFDESVLNEYEFENARRMLEVEQGRGSQYLP